MENQSVAARATATNSIRCCRRCTVLIGFVQLKPQEPEVYDADQHRELSQGFSVTTEISQHIIFKKKKTETEISSETLSSGVLDHRIQQGTHGA
jgi:hypothetical protein